jgi:hypothetical protein
MFPVQALATASDTASTTDFFSWLMEPDEAVASPRTIESIPAAVEWAGEFERVSLASRDTSSYTQAQTMIYISKMQD